MSDALVALIELQTRVQTVGRGYEQSDSAARCNELFATIRAALEQAEENTVEARVMALEKLKDPAVVYTNMTRGIVATPRFRDMVFHMASLDGFFPDQARADLEDEIKKRIRGFGND